MAITDPMRLAPDVVLVSVSELPSGIRSKLAAQDGDFALTRRRGRAPSKIVPAAGADLLREFRAERTIVDAVVAYSQTQGLDARDVLASAYDMLRECMDARFLVPADSAVSTEVVATLARGDVVGSFEIQRPVHVMEDVEVYQGRSRDGRPPAIDHAAIKIVRAVGASKGLYRLDREVEVLGRMNGSCAPRLLEVGEVQGRRYLAAEWRSGVSPRVVAGELRAVNTIEANRALLGLCSRLLAAYVELHAACVIHGDVHARNVLVDRTDVVTLLDFGLSRLMDAEGVAQKGSRGGVAYFYEPEYAVARLNGHPRPPPTEAGEQHAVAALLYVLLTGERYLDFSIDERGMLRQIANDPPLPFARRGRTAWPQVEEALGVALAKDPAERFPSMRGFLETWREIDALEGLPARPSGRHASPPPTDLLLADWIGRVDARESYDSDSEEPTGPFSVWYGAAGVAYALYRMACIRDDSRLLFKADHWVAQAERSLREGRGETGHAGETRHAGETGHPGENGFNGEGARGDQAVDMGAEPLPDHIGRTSPFHTRSGVHAVRALIARAMGDSRACESAISEFVGASDGGCAILDLTLGRSGTLLISSVLLEALAGTPPLAGSEAERSLRRLGQATLSEIWSTARESPGPLQPIRNLGMAHGRAGILYATMRWCEAARVPLPPEVERELDELSDRKEHKGRGVRWPWFVENGNREGGRYMPGWCNGSAGFVFLWTQALRSFGRPEFATLSEQSAWNAWEESGATPHLCCGLAGRAHALLEVYRETGDPAWMQRATDMAQRAAALARRRVDDSEPSLSLFRADTGVALLAADLTCPDRAFFPMVGREGWPRA